jgi:hypothetical protein
MWCSVLWCRRFRIHRYVAAPHNRLFISVISVILTLIFMWDKSWRSCSPLSLPPLIQLHFRLHQLYWWDACRLGRIIGSIYRVRRKIRTKNYKQCRLFGLYQLPRISKIPNPKCRLYWCLIEFIDWRLERQSVMLVFSTPLVKYCPSNLLTGSAAEEQVQGDDDCASDSKILVLLKWSKIYITFLKISLPIPFSLCGRQHTVLLRRFFSGIFLFYFKYRW